MGEAVALPTHRRQAWAKALLSLDGAAVDAEAQGTEQPLFPALLDNAASVGGFLLEKLMVHNGHDPAALRRKSDEKLAELVLVPLQQTREVSRAERRSIGRAAGAIVRDWRRVPGLWRGGREYLWLFNYLVPAGVVELRAAGHADVLVLAAEWLDATGAPPEYQ